MNSINITEDNYKIFYDIYNVPAFAILLRLFREETSRSTYICHECKDEILHKIVHGASDPVLCRKLGGLVPLFNVLKDEGLTSSSSYGLDFRPGSTRVPQPEPTDFIAALIPDKWHKILQKGWCAFLVNYLVGKLGPGYSSDEIEELSEKELGSLVGKLMFLGSGTYTVLDLYHDRDFEEYAFWTCELLAKMDCPSGNCKALKWLDLVGPMRHRPELSGTVKALDGEDALVWAKICMFTIRSLMDSRILEVIDEYPGLIPHLEKEFDVRDVLPSAAKRYAWRPKRLVEVIIKDAAKALQSAVDKGYFKELILDGKDIWANAKQYAIDAEEEVYGRPSNY
ncbi:hypothetical protein B0T20DRAFT_78775 [Sordaria brevicollis]|uniref:Uncharacterized protein n=1 Tax=Sordaria brevicollis TaxID=83679 RepID=A0AAE0P125_SORBR|nr:hypothetical protein B0T20DRAFT_78775 [Sordaria brevicollis]